MGLILLLWVGVFEFWFWFGVLGFVWVYVCGLLVVFVLVRDWFVDVSLWVLCYGCLWCRFCWVLVDCVFVLVLY